MTDEQAELPDRTFDEGLAALDEMIKIVTNGEIAQKNIMRETGTVNGEISQMFNVMLGDLVKCRNEVAAVRAKWLPPEDGPQP